MEFWIVVVCAVLSLPFLVGLGSVFYRSWWSPEARAYALGYEDWTEERDVSDEFSSMRLRAFYRDGRNDAARDFERMSERMLMRLDKDRLKRR